MNKVQKIIITIWVILLTIAFIITINPIVTTTTYTANTDINMFAKYQPNWGEFIGLSLIISIPVFILYKVWKTKK